MAKTSGRSVNDSPTVPSQFGIAPYPHNRTVLGFATLPHRATHTCSKATTVAAVSKSPVTEACTRCCESPCSPGKPTDLTTPWSVMLYKITPVRPCRCANR